MNNKQDIKVFIEHGNVLYRQAKYIEAIARYKAAVDFDPNAIQGYYNWGNALRKLGKYAEAISKYRKAIEISPNLIHAYNNWGLILYDLGDYEQAIIKFSKTTEINSEFSQAYNNWGLALDALGNYSEAITKYRIAIDLNLNYAEAYYNWGNALLAQRDFQEAASKYGRAVNLNQEYSRAFHNWGVALAAEGKYDEAIKMYQRTIEVDPSYNEAYTNWGLVLSEQGKHEEAMDIFVKGIKMLAANAQNKVQLVKLFHDEITKDELRLSDIRTEINKEEFKKKLASIKLILDSITREEKVKILKEPQDESKTRLTLQLPNEHNIEKDVTNSDPSPKSTYWEESREEKSEEKEITSNSQLSDYYNFLVQELRELFETNFTVKDNKLVEKYELLLSTVTLAASFLPPLYNAPFDETVFPLISKVAPDGILLEDILSIRKINKVQQKFLKCFSTQDETKQIVIRIAKKLTLTRKEQLLNSSNKVVNPKSVYKMRQARARGLIKKERIENKSEEYAFFDYGVLILLTFLEGIRVQDSTDSSQKVVNVSNAILETMKQYFDGITSQNKTSPEWCNIM